MSEYSEYQQYFYQNKQKKVQPAKSVLLFCLIVLVFMVILFFLIKPYFNKNKTKENTLYFTYSMPSVYLLSLATFQNKNIAYQNIYLYENMGAGSYVYSYCDKYEIIGAIYKSEKDAKKVQQNLEEEKVYTKIIELKFTKFFLDFDITKAQKNALNNLFYDIYDIYINIYNASVKFDKNEIDAENFESELAILIQSFEKKLSIFKQDFAIVYDSSIYLVKSLTEDIKSNLLEFTKIDDSEITSSSIKNLYITHLFFYVDFLNKM